MNEIAELLKSRMDSGIADGVFPSAVAAVGKGETLLARAHVGHLSEGDKRPVNVDTRYDMASITKILAPTMLALRAIEQGELTLLDSIGRFFDAPADKRDISVEQLMTHTSGISPHFDLREEARDADDALAAILCHPLVGTPGDMPRYSCMGYIILGKMLEKVYGERLDIAAQMEVFAPLSMAHTSYRPKGDNIAATEIDPQTGLPLVGVVHDENARFLGGVSANAGVFSDITDMAKYAVMLAQMGGDFLSPVTMRAAIRNRTPVGDQHRGLGFQLGGTWGCFLGALLPQEAFGHTGFTGTSIAVDPETGFWAVLLTNRVNPSRERTGIPRFRRAFHNALYAAAMR